MSLNTFLFILLIIPFSGQAKNLGHRSGGGPQEFHKDVAENSLLALKFSLEGRDGEIPIQDSDEFLYLEFDVQETKDQKLVIFHDKTLIRMIPNIGRNRDLYEELLNSEDFKRRIPFYRRFASGLKVSDLYLEDLKRFWLNDSFSQKIPTLEEFLNYLEKYQIRKPVAIEIKYLRTDKARAELLRQLSHFNKEYMQKNLITHLEGFDMPFDIGMIGFKKNFKNSFGKSQKNIQYWCSKMKDLNLYGVFRTYSHDNMCE